MKYNLAYYDNGDLACYNGYSFRKDKKIGYYLSSKKIGNSRKRLHRYIWETENNAQIPKGYDIHHKDGNKSNNDVSNLMLVNNREHTKIHERNLTEEQRAKRAENIVKNGLPKAIEWHKSRQGREWHSEHGKRVAESLLPVKYVCTYCGKEFETKNRYSEKSNTFCSNNCKSAFRRKSGVDDIFKECEKCGEKFKANKYSKVKYCQKCGRKKH